MHRHHAGTLLLRPVAAADSRTDCWGLSVRELWPFVHRGRSVCDECRGFRVPAAATPHKDRGAKGLTWLGRSASSVGMGGRVNQSRAAGTATSWPGPSGLDTRWKQILVYELRFVSCLAEFAAAMVEYWTDDHLSCLNTLFFYLNH